MNNVIRNILAVLAGVAVGTLVNMGLVMVGPEVIPMPEGIDINDPESYKANMHLMKTQNFLFPFLAHALGTLAAAFTAVKLSTNKHLGFGLGLGGWFLLGGIAACFMIPAPTWFMATDLLLAYLPMGWLGWKLAGGTSYDSEDSDALLNTLRR